MRRTVEVDRKEKVHITKSQDYVMVEFDGPWETYLLTTEMFENQDGYHCCYKWLFNVENKFKYVAVQSNFLTNYYFKGFEYKWEPYKSYIQEPNLLFAKNDSSRFYQDYRLWDTGFLFFNNEPVCRPIPLEIGEMYYNLVDVEKYLTDHPKVSDVKNAESDSDEIHIWGNRVIKFIYHPTEEEFKELCCNSDTLWTSYYKDRAQRKLELEKFLKPQYRGNNE